MSGTVSEHILVVRNDKLGDFMLAFPAFALLKTALPQARIAALVPAYTAEMAEACQWIDEVLIDNPDPNNRRADRRTLRNLFQAEQFDALISLYSTTRVAMAARAAGISYRLAPATKLAQIFYNHKLKQRRSRSEKPEYAYNVDLVQRFLDDQGIAVPSLPPSPYLHFPDEEVAARKERFVTEHQLNADDRLIFLHPGSGGSARNLSLPQYADLIRRLAEKQDFTLVLSCAPAEQDAAQQLAALLPHIRHVTYVSRQGLREFAMHLQFADLFISGSTGPLHIAGALDVPTAAFYPRRRSATSLRWQTLNSEAKRVSFMPPENAEAEDMQSIDLESAARQISDKLLAGR